MIPFDLERASHVWLTIHDVTGRLVATLDGGDRVAGAGRVVWSGVDARGTPVWSGIYEVRLTTCDEVRTGKIVLTK